MNPTIQTDCLAFVAACFNGASISTVNSDFTFRNDLFLTAGDLDWDLTTNLTSCSRLTFSSDAGRFMARGGPETTMGDQAFLCPTGNFTSPCKASEVLLLYTQEEQCTYSVTGYGFFSASGCANLDDHIFCANVENQLIAFHDAGMACCAASSSCPFRCHVAKYDWNCDDSHPCFPEKPPSDFQLLVQSIVGTLMLALVVGGLIAAWFYCRKHNNTIWFRT